MAGSSPTPVEIAKANNDKASQKEIVIVRILKREKDQKKYKRLVSLPANHVARLQCQSQ